MKSKFVIVNLKRRIDRKENLKSILNARKIEEYEFFEAVDGKMLKGDQFIYNLFLGNDFNWRRGVIGCALSHHNIWKMLSKSDYDYFCILEDDINLSQKFKKSYLDCQNFINNNQVDILLLGYTMFSKNREANKDIYDCPDNDISFHHYRSDLYIGGFFGYIITKSGANKMLKYIQENGIKHGIDYLIKINKDLIIYESHPLIIFSDWVESLKSKVDSDIQKDFNILTFDTSEMYKIVTLNGNKYKFYQGLDSFGNDIRRVNSKKLDEIVEEAEKDSLCIAFNSLGFLKSVVDKIDKSPYIHSINHGLFIKLSERAC